MRGLISSLAIIGAGLVAATPAAAQYYPGPQTYGYGYNRDADGQWGQVGMLQARIDRVEQQIRMLDRRNIIRDESADRLKDEAHRLEHQLHRAARYGLNPYEANDMRTRIAWLEQRVQYAAMNGYGRYGRGDRDDRGYGDGYERRGYDEDGGRN